MSTCKICGKYFATNANLKRHTLQVYEKNVFQCEDCSKKFVRQSDLKRHSYSVHSTEKIVCEFCGTPFTGEDNLLHHLNNKNCERELKKEEGKRKIVDLTVSSKKKKTQFSTFAEDSAAAPKNSTTEEHSAVAENSTAVPENSDVVPKKVFLPPKESESALQKAYKTFDLLNNNSSRGIKEFLLLRKEETIFIFRNELETYKALKVRKWVHCIYSKQTDAGKMIKSCGKFI
ncbi:hypothetical protein TNCV_2518781 [Trichonephila clavipes]|nr:hypothetical protein TNCV_2518781 [Trichonephila clavipes]